MTAHRTVNLRDMRFDTVKAAIGSAMARTAPDQPGARTWAATRWGEGGVPRVIDKAAVAALTIGDADPTANNPHNWSLVSGVPRKPAEQAAFCVPMRHRGRNRRVSSGRFAGQFGAQSEEQEKSCI